MSKWTDLGVRAIKKTDEKYQIGNSEGKIIDYAVLMKRMDETKPLDVLLDQGTVNTDAIIKLADKLASFHQNATIVSEGADWKKLYNEFEDILSVQDFFEQNFGEDIEQFIEELNRQAHQFLKTNQKRIGERNENGFTIDGHGDLHAKNIFLLEDPVIFDCIEFNEDLRKGDQLNEIAFLCMNLERFGRFDLSEVFFERYLSKTGCIENKTDEQLFLFYKLYRANVRLKVLAIDAQESRGTGEHREEVMRTIDKQVFGIVQEVLRRFEKLMRLADVLPFSFDSKGKVNSPIGLGI